MVLVLLEQKCAFMLLGFPDEDELTVQLEAYLNLYLSHLVSLDSL
jgi:hypothetical protein